MLLSSGISSWPGSTHCLQFWFHMAGSADGDAQLRVKIQRANGSLSAALWGRNAQRTSNWYQAIVPIAESNPFQVCVKPWVYLQIR